jgi:hypothetical protein
VEQLRKFFGYRILVVRHILHLYEKKLKTIMPAASIAAMLVSVSVKGHKNRFS